jgi:ubiquinone/menaquinone biosynthesis C-methylase UbiE
MAQNGFQLSGNAAAIYEEQKVPAMFAPLADATLNVVSLFDDDIVLDVACGTGVLARKVRGKTGPRSRIVGIDLNEGMISTAKGLTDPASQSCEWQIANATDLPFGDDTFSMVLCQQGLQFIPDKEGALREMHRVLRHEGRVALTVWNGMADFMVPIAHALRRYVSDEVAEKAKAPFAYNGTALLQIISDIGFADVSIENLTINRTIRATNSAIRDEILGLPIASSVEDKGDDVLKKIIQETLSGLSKFSDGSDFIVPQHTHLIQGRAA